MDNENIFKSSHEDIDPDDDDEEKEDKGVLGRGNEENASKIHFDSDDNDNNVDEEKKDKDILAGGNEENASYKNVLASI